MRSTECHSSLKFVMLITVYIKFNQSIKFIISVAHCRLHFTINSSSTRPHGRTDTEEPDSAWCSEFRLQC